MAKFYAEIQDGQIKDLEYIKHLAKWNGQKVAIEVKLDRNNRSNNQNRYYHSIVLGLISETTGYTPEEVHELLKAKFLSAPLRIGTETFNIATTTKQTTVEFEEFLRKIRQWASIELSCYIPLPREGQRWI